MKFKRLKNITNSIEKKQAPYYVRKHLEFLCQDCLENNKFDKPLFETQADLAGELAKNYPDMRSVNQSSVSRALNPLLLHDLIDNCGRHYKIIKKEFKKKIEGKVIKKHGYFLCLRYGAADMMPLYDTPNIFLKDSAFKLTDTVVIFKVISDTTRVKDFIRLIESTLSEELFWGISHQGSYLYLMFNKDYAGWASYRDAFLKFFDSRKDILGEDVVDREIRKANIAEKKR